MRTIAAKLVCWPISSGFRCRSKPWPEFGIGKNYGKTADLRTRDKKPLTRSGVATGQPI